MSCSAPCCGEVGGERGTSRRCRHHSALAGAPSGRARGGRPPPPRLRVEDSSFAALAASGAAREAPRVVHWGDHKVDCRGVEPRVLRGGARVSARCRKACRAGREGRGARLQLHCEYGIAGGALEAGDRHRRVATRADDEGPAAAGPVSVERLRGEMPGVYADEGAPEGRARAECREHRLRNRKVF